jgi:hypothetical protein
MVLLAISFVGLIVIEIHFFMQPEYAMLWHHVGPICPHKNEILPNIVGVHIVDGENVLNRCILVN